MSLETATFINDLVATNPTSSDNISQGDDQIRMLKAVLQATFPGASKAFSFPSTEAITANETVTLADQNKTYLADTTSGSIDLTLPTLGVGDAGWEIGLIKTNTGTNPVFIVPASGTIQSGEVSGLAKARRCIPGHRTKILWTGTAWIAERVVRAPVGAVIDFTGASLPVGYEWPNGQTLSSASTNYPEFYSVNASSGVVLDARGRVVAGKDDMGGSSANRLTNQTGGLNGDTLGATGGSETHTLTEAQMPTHNHTASVTDPGHTHSYTRPVNNQTWTGVGGATSTTTDNTSSATTGISVSIGNKGSSEAHNNVQPTIVMNKLLVVE